jgi:phage-related protein
MGHRSGQPRRTAVSLRWRDYETPSGRRPVKEFIDDLADDDAAAIVAAMKDVQLIGLEAARHLRGDIYEVRAEGNKQAFRVLFAQEGKKGRILLALEAISKKTQKTPNKTIALSERRLGTWRRRGRN